MASKTPRATMEDDVRSAHHRPGSRARRRDWGVRPLDQAAPDPLGRYDEEAARVLPFDELVPDPTWSSTRALTIEATPEQIWPWLVQVGWGRAGWYGYDWVDNGGKPSAWEIMPEYQHLEAGTKFAMSPWTAMYCWTFGCPRWILPQMANNPEGKGIGSFLWLLEPIDERRTRFIIRMRDKYRWFNPVILPMQLTVDVLDIFFQWKHMLGVRARAERLAAEKRMLVYAGEHKA